ncbi:MAG: type II secretion system F family protein [Rhizobiaceae bacterium]|nr:type II secretion system F family protein [Rhizobiaceae bacterium]
MIDLIYSLTEPQTLVSVLAAVAMFATMVTIAMPFLQKDELNTRMKSVAIERDKIRARERARLAEQSKRGTLKQSGGGFYQDFAEKLNLRKMLADENTFQSLVMAGYRKKAHVNVFLVFKMVVPICLLLGALLYTFVLTSNDRGVMSNILLSMVVAMVGFYLPSIIIKNKISKRQLSIRRAWPDCLDLLLICVESGMSLEASMKKVAVEVGIQSPELAEELTLTTAELSYLQERRQAHENLAKRTGLDIVKAVTMALIQAERYGTPLATALRALSQESRDMRMAEAEKKAAALPPKLTVPMIVFFLPVLFAVILGPAIIQISNG